MIANKAKYFDIAANLSTPHYSGVYKGKKLHDPDFDAVVKRASDVGCEKLLITSSYLRDSQDCLKLAQKNDHFYCTIGVHPTRTNDIEKNGGLDKYIKGLEKVIEEAGDKCVAIGECGLDYDRFNFSDKETQNKYFPFHFDLAEKYKKPMYLHDRNTGGDFYKIIKENRKRFPGGVVHSFTGNADELKQYLELDLYIGINGCSLKKKKNLEVAKQVPLNRLMLETDCPYCEVKHFNAGFNLIKTKFETVAANKHDKNKMIDDRNEPCKIVQIAEILAEIMQKDVREIADAAYANTIELFGIKDETFVASIKK